MTNTVMFSPLIPLLMAINNLAYDNKVTKPEIGIIKSIPSLNCFKTARYTHLSRLTIAVLCFASLSGCFIVL